MKIEAPISEEPTQLEASPFARHSGGRRLAVLVQSKGYSNTVFLLLVLYATLVYFSICISNFEDFHRPFLILEFCFLSLFTLEIAGRVLVRSPARWGLLLDAAVVAACAVLAVVQTASPERPGTKYFKCLCLLRFLTAVPITRKRENTRPANGKQALIQSAANPIAAAPAAEVVEFLQQLRSEFPFDPVIDAQLAWSAEVIAQNRLYDVQVNFTSHRKPGEILPWIRNYSQTETLRHSSMISEKPLPEDLLHSDSQVPISAAVESCLRSVLSRKFDVFVLKGASDNCELLILMMHFFAGSHLFGLFPREEFERWVTSVQKGYAKINPYHNATHASDVLQTFHFLLEAREAAAGFSLHPLDTAACYLSACIHDYEHPGVSARFLVATRDPLALLYNDRSVLENHHIAAAFQLARSASHNLFRFLKPEDYSYLRRLIVTMVLATDISRHFALISQFESRFEAQSGEVREEDKTLAMEMMLHCCDISNPSKPWALCRQWAELILQEFFAQGDREKQLHLPVSDSCDRETTTLSRSQVAFIDAVVMPSFQALARLLPGLSEELQTLHDNRERWKLET